MIKPKTRKEKLLSAIANDAPVTIQPKNREELFLAQIAEKVNTVNAPIAETLSEEAHVLVEDGGEVKRVSKSKVGGGGSVPKPLTYDYMPEGYPKVETVETDKEYMPEHTVETVTGSKYTSSTIENSGNIVSSFLVVGHRYAVIFNGERYEMTATDTRRLGNQSLRYTAQEDTGEPFFINIAMQNNISVYTTTPGTHTFAIYEIVESEKEVPIAHKFLPAGYPYKTEETAVLFAKEGIVADSALEEYATPLGLVVGNEYEVVYNGVTYACVAGEANMGVTVRYLGDKKMMTEGAVGTGEPFVIFDSDTPIEDGLYWGIAAIDGSETFDISITGVKREIKVMAEDLLPAFAKRKRFKVMVDKGAQNGGFVYLESVAKEDITPTFTAADVYDAYVKGYDIDLEIGVMMHDSDGNEIPSYTILPLSHVWAGEELGVYVRFTGWDESDRYTFSIASDDYMLGGGHDWKVGP